MINEVNLTDTEKEAIKYFWLDYAESEEEGAGWFCYQDYMRIHPDYRDSSCECLEDVVEWYQAAIQHPLNDETTTRLSARIIKVFDEECYTCKHAPGNQSPSA
jgi:hypothetical protein